MVGEWAFLKLWASDFQVLGVKKFRKLAISCWCFLNPSHQRPWQNAFDYGFRYAKGRKDEE